MVMPAQQKQKQQQKQQEPQGMRQMLLKRQKLWQWMLQGNPQLLLLRVSKSLHQQQKQPHLQQLLLLAQVGLQARAAGRPAAAKPLAAAAAAAAAAATGWPGPGASLRCVLLYCIPALNSLAATGWG
jgi:hypothetical protein